MKLVWDGERFFEADDDTAAKMVAEDKGEICRGQAVKYRHQFAGYLTREMRAEAPTAPAAKEVEIIQEEVEATAPPFNWEDHREAYKAATGARRANEKAVTAWAKEEGLLT